METNCEILSYVNTKIYTINYHFRQKLVKAFQINCNWCCCCGNVVFAGTLVDPASPLR